MLRRLPALAQSLLPSRRREGAAKATSSVSLHAVVVCDQSEAWRAWREGPEAHGAGAVVCAAARQR